MLDDGIFVRIINEFPLSIRGVTTPNSDGTFSVYINGRLTPEQQKQALEHELRHIRYAHLYDCESVAQNENEAEGIYTRKITDNGQQRQVEAAPLTKCSVGLNSKQAKRLVYDSLKASKQDMKSYKLGELEDNWLFDVG